ncbi:hypothetical protein, partial [Massilia glaciei]|uniref:hypothetical protein n=1 Tax=Massilia glaciei TaxID=1524097 RepID=UPI001C628125
NDFLSQVGCGRRLMYNDMVLSRLASSANATLVISLKPADAIGAGCSNDVALCDRPWVGATFFIEFEVIYIST